MDLVNNSGMTIRVEELYARRTYTGLLAGTKAMATRIFLEDISRAGVPAEWNQYPVVGIGVDHSHRSREYELPPVTIIALLVSMRVAGVDSVLIAVWFQDEMFAPPTMNILNELRALDWNRLAAPEQYYG